MDVRTLVILLLVAAVGVLGYLYYDSQQGGVSIQAPGVHIEAR